MAFSLTSLLRPNSVGIYKKKPGPFQQFLLNNIAISSDEGVRFDLTSQETESRSWTVPRHPVAQGFAVSDHVQRNPIVFTVQGTLTATPIGNLLNPQIGAFGNFLRRDLKALADLEAIADRGDLVVVVTEEKAFPRMVITSLQRNKDPDAGNAVDISVTFEEMRVVAPLLGASLIDEDAMSFGAAASSDAGVQSANEIEPTVGITDIGGRV